MTIEEFKEEFLEYLKRDGKNSIKEIQILIGKEYPTDEKKTFQDYWHLFKSGEIKVYILPSKESSTGVKESR